MAAAADEKSSGGTQRLDKWLWFTRLVKSRTLAATLIGDGKVRLNRQRIDKPSQIVKVGDVVTAAIHRRVVVIKVLELGERRGPAAEAQLLYEDLSAPEPGSDAEADATAGGRTQRAGRPNKRDRRELSALKRGGRTD